MNFCNEFLYVLLTTVAPLGFAEPGNAFISWEYPATKWSHTNLLPLPGRRTVSTQSKRELLFKEEEYRQCTIKNLEEYNSESFNRIICCCKKRPEIARFLQQQSELDIYVLLAKTMKQKSILRDESARALRELLLQSKRSLTCSEYEILRKTHAIFDHIAFEKDLNALWQGCL